MFSPNPRADHHLQVALRHFGLPDFIPPILVLCRGPRSRASALCLSVPLTPPSRSSPADLARIRTDERSAEGSRDVERTRNPETRTVQGRASIELLGRAGGPESPRIGYAPLVNRTKQWATESQIEGWFPPPGGERQSWKVTRTTDEMPSWLQDRRPHWRRVQETGSGTGWGQGLAGRLLLPANSGSVGSKSGV